MLKEHHYQVDLTWNSDRKGTISSPKLDQTIEVATPPEFEKGLEGIWSPEHLFVASVNSCLMTTFLAISEYSKLDFTDFESKAVGKLEKIDGQYMVSEITLSPVLMINREKDREKAERILEKSKDGCLISNSIKTKINFDPKVILGELV